MVNLNTTEIPLKYHSNTTFVPLLHTTFHFVVIISLNNQRDILIMSNKNLENTSPNHSDFLRNRVAAKYLGLSEVTIWRLCETDPEFPKKIRITKRCVGFRKSELDAYLELKKSA